MKNQDFLNVCNDQRVAEPDFRAAFCSRCMQPECVRSIHGTSKFDQRVSTWRERLFTAVPSMDPSDPRAAAASAAQFVSIDAPSKGTSGQVPSSWGSEEKIENGVARGEAPGVLSGIQETTVATGEKTPPLSPLEEARHVASLNTPVQHGIMLPGAPEVVASKAKSKADPWAAPIPAGHDPAVGTVINKGAKFRLGS